MVGYNLQFSPDLKKDFPDRQGSLVQPMPPQLTRLVRRYAAELPPKQAN
jgi:hypothetical protein